MDPQLLSSNLPLGGEEMPSEERIAGAGPKAERSEGAEEEPLLASSRYFPVRTPPKMAAIEIRG